MILRHTQSYIFLMWISLSLLSLTVSIFGSPVNKSPYVQVIGKQLLVDGKPFNIKGVCYSPVPMGESVSFIPYGDYFKEQYAYIWKRDLPLIKAMGANSIRIYGWDLSVDHTEFLNEVHAHGLHVLVTFFLGTAEQNPVLTAGQRQKIIDEFQSEVKKYGDHPGILGWCFGNELNGAWNLFLSQLSASFACNWNINCVNNPYGTCASPVACVYKALFRFINDAIAAAKRVSSRPMTSGFADIDQFVGSPPNPAIDKISLYEYLLPDMDMWSMQLYMGKSFGDYFINYQKESSKPLVVTEYGVDAYNDPCGWPENDQVPVCFNMWARSDFGGDESHPGFPFRGCMEKDEACAVPGIESQANWDGNLTLEIVNSYPQHGGSVAGGFVMAWSDEYWKGAIVQDKCKFPCPVIEADECRTSRVKEFMPGGSAGCMLHSHFTCGNDDTNYHDLCGYWLPAFPDHYVNEEWFGITTPVDCGLEGYGGGSHLDTLEIRPVYFQLQKLWTGTSKPISSPSCNDLKPCWSCLQEQSFSLSATNCRHLCLSAQTIIKPITALSKPWHFHGFWTDYGVWIISLLSVILFTVLALLWLWYYILRYKRKIQHPILCSCRLDYCWKKRSQDTVPQDTSNYGSVSLP